jgi:hypothetical protein
MAYEAEDSDPWIRLRFRLTSDQALDLSVVSERTGLDPDTLFKAGDSRTNGLGRTLNPYAYSCWGVLLCDERAILLSELLERAVDTLEPKGEAIQEVMSEFGLEAQLGVHTFLSHECTGPGQDAPLGSAPDGQFSKRVIRFLADINAAIDLDLYLTGDPDFGTRSSRSPGSPAHGQHA